MTEAAKNAPIVALDGVSRSYGAIHALRDATMALIPGEVRALMGENGAGKSTMVKMLTGVERPTNGQVFIDGEAVTLHSTADARDAGIAVILQEPTLFPDLTVAENVVMGRHPRRSFGRVDRPAMRKMVQELLGRLGVELDPDRPVQGLSIADQQIVEIAKAMSFDARVL
ncbi:MAG: ATP-binding cassette domain-containing protein, partial [Solirubrobacteraceae bacterium]